MDNEHCMVCRNTACILYGICNTCYLEVMETEITERSNLIMLNVPNFDNLSNEILLSESEKVYFQYYSNLHKFLKIKSCGHFIKFEI